MEWIREYCAKTIQSTTFHEITCHEHGVWQRLKLLAGANDRNPGIVEKHDGVSWSMQLLAELICCPYDEFVAAIKRLQEVDKIRMLDDGRIKISNWERYQTQFARYRRGRRKQAKPGGIAKCLDCGYEYPGDYEACPRCSAGDSQ